MTGIDLERRRVFLDGAEPGSNETGRELEYHHLVLALGSVSNYLGMANVVKFAFNFKSLLDAIRIRNHVIEMFETADREQNVELHRKLLTFVVAGGGFAGVELAGALNDFAHSIFPDYRNLAVKELSVILVHSRDRILPELSEALAGYSLEKMKQRGVIFRLEARLVDVQPGLVILSDGQIPADTLIWTAGTAPSPLLKMLAFEKNKRGAVIVDSFLAVPGHSGVWAARPSMMEKPEIPVPRRHSSRFEKLNRLRQTSARHCQARQANHFISIRSDRYASSAIRRPVPS